MATSLTSWAPYILPQITGCPFPALERAVRDAAIGFCEETLLWTYDLTRISVVANQANYTLTVPTNVYGEIISIDDVKYKQNGLDDDQFVTLTPISQNQMDLHENGAWKFLTAATPSNYYIEEDDTATLYLWKKPTEASTSGLLVRANLRPTDTCTTVQDFLYSTFSRVIADGALADLFAMRAMPWYDVVEAVRREMKFREGVAGARMKKATGATKRPLRVKMRAGIGL